MEAGYWLVQHVFSPFIQTVLATKKQNSETKSSVLGRHTEVGEEPASVTVMLCLCSFSIFALVPEKILNQQGDFYNSTERVKHIISSGNLTTAVFPR